MKISEMRTELLGQHDTIRGLVAEVEGALSSTQSEGAGAVHDALRRLQSALDHHNRREEQLLEGLLPSLDAWGDARAAWMDLRHREEHAESVAAIRVALGVEDPAARAATVRALLAEISAHVAREEVEFLSPDVLTDDRFKLSDGVGG
ncbi:MAG: hemerythrin domain-containing protein [Polyangiales bacterium]